MKNELHPIELLILLAIVVASALLDLAVATTALVLTIAGWQPSRPTPAPAPARPLISPLLLELEGLTVAQLQPLAGTRSKKHRKAELITMAGMAMAC
jgi:hypothetical protein